MVNSVTKSFSFFRQFQLSFSKRILGPVLTLSAVLLSAMTFALTSPAFAQTKVVAPDNSAKNIRDLSAKELTAMDQSNDPKDIETSRKIREALTSDSSLSTYAQNVKIIVAGRKITLKGPVRSETERSKILKTANGFGRDYQVDNQLQISN